MKNINDYKTPDGKIGIYCSSQEEWNKVCDLLGAASGNTIGKGYQECPGWDTIGLYCNSWGWSNKDHYEITYPASDFVEVKLNFIIY